jgi:hypothetical protein
MRMYAFLPRIYYHFNFRCVTSGAEKALLNYENTSHLFSFLQCILCMNLQECTYVNFEDNFTLTWLDRYHAFGELLFAEVGGNRFFRYFDTYIPNYTLAHSKRP